jgi:phosphate acetyltransferase
MKTKSLYISSLESGAGALSTSIGIMQFLKQRFVKVAFFRPIVKDEDDYSIDFMLEHFKLKQDKKDTFGYKLQQLENDLSLNKHNEIYENLIQKVQHLQQNYDFVLIHGQCKEFIFKIIDFDINLTLSKHFNSPFVSILSGKNKTNKQISEDIKIATNSISKEDVSHFATFVNNVTKENIKILKESIDANKTLLFFIPTIKDLDRLTVLEVKKSLDAKLIFGDKKNLNKKIGDIKIASMTLENFLRRIKNENFIIVSGDRSDIVLGSLSAIHSKAMPHISGIILTGNLQLSNQIMNLLDGFEDSGICILKIDTDTYQTALNITKTKPMITSKNYKKIALILGNFIKYVDHNQLTNTLNLSKSDILTPVMFEFNLFEKARVDKKHIVLNESDDDRILRAIEILLHRKIVNITLIGDKDKVLYRAGVLGLNISKAKIIDPTNSSLTDIFAKEFYNLRKHKGISLEDAKDLMMTNSTYFATMMVHLGYAHGMVSGAVGTTADTVRPALQIIKTKKGIDIVSSVFFMCLDTKVLVFGDCAINPSPNAKELSQIAISSANTAKQFGIEPKIAMLSYSTGTSGSGEDVQLVAQATAIVKQNHNFTIQGPIQYDAAIDKNTALKKSPDGVLKGDATILIFPDLNTGNNTYKAVQRSSGAVAIGPVLQGLNKPINDLSRGCKIVDIINTVAITAIQAQQKV